MINTIIFDFGDVLINLDKETSLNEFKKLGLDGPNPELLKLNDDFERGKITEDQFLEGFRKNLPNASIDQIKAAWNSIIGDFPLYRLEFLQLLSTKYRLFLLTNTDIIHMENFEDQVGMSFASDFYRCFEKVYYSHEMGMRKPDESIFNFILKKHDLSPKRTLFVDDKKENTDAAAALGINVWNLQPDEDVVNLFEKKFMVVDA
ncbi:HAD family hydrolase [Flavobacterium pallidum]|uniref:Haloacid dehalogenase n=1 Tax=Flavobacterium pallidum TaxID=2172098 RepID=A0A2S1SL24_9FLAO|nr:HAD family phosphatase [Flavobacterium pallidum]AWI27114.1 haloacid dehalogenase [Flavobacterium pallidum]